MQRSPADPMTDPRDLIEAATPLPWRIVPWKDGYLIKGPKGTRFEHTIIVDYSDPEDVGAELADARLILAAANHLPALLDVADALERLAPKDALETLGDDELVSVSWPDVHYRVGDYRNARRALARLRESRDD